MKAIGEWIWTEYLEEDGPVAKAIQDLTETAVHEMEKRKNAPAARKKKFDAVADILNTAAEKAAKKIKKN